MQTRVAQVGEIIVVHLTGHLDVETAEPFRHACMKYLIDKKVVFNFQELSFVGSSGILPFLETTQDFARANRAGFRFCSMGIEFRKVFSATPFANLDVFDNEDQAVQALLNSGSTAPAISIGAVQAVPILDEPSPDDE